MDKMPESFTGQSPAISMDVCDLQQIAPFRIQNASKAICAEN